MNSIRCNKCGNFVADNTPFCPYCGNPIRAIPPQPKNNNNVLLAIIILLLSLIVGMMVWMFWGDKIVGKVRGKEKPREEMVAPAKDAGDAEDIRDAEADVPGAEADADVSSTAAPAAPAVAEEVAAPAAVAPVAPPPPVVRNKVANGTYRLNGAIMHKQNYYIDMEVYVKGNQAKGRYIVYNGENVYVNLSGTIDANGNMRLTEYKNGVATGYYFTGRFNQNTYSGKYKSTNRKLTMNFSASTY